MSAGLPLRPPSVGCEPPCGEGPAEDSAGGDRASFEGAEVWREAEGEADGEPVAGADEPSLDGLTVGVVGVAEGGVVVVAAVAVLVGVVVVGEGGVEAQALDRAADGELDRPERP